MQTVVITGSTRGIGFGMAQEFLKRGHRVVVNGRSEASTQKAVTALAADKDRVLGVAADVGDYAQVQTLWQKAVERFGRVDIWVNNAGMSNPMHPFWEQPAERIESVARTNFLGAMYGSKVAVAGMLAQGGGTVYNMEGFGSTGQFRAGLLLYGTTKYGVHYLTKNLAKEVAKTSVKVCRLSPGIVITDLLMEGYVGKGSDLARAQRIFNILGDTVETVTPYLVEQILKNGKNGAYINWLTTPKVFMRFMTAGFNKRNLFAPAQ